MPRKIMTIILVTLFSACVAVDSSVPRKKSKVAGQAGQMIPEFGLTFGARYNPELDQLVPGYKIITVAMTNNSVNQLTMDPAKDRWWIRLLHGRKVKAIGNLRLKDPKKWFQLPEKKRQLMEPPLYIPIGYTQTFDLFVSDKINLGHFRSIAYTNTASRVTFEIETNE